MRRWLALVLCCARTTATVVIACVGDSVTYGNHGADDDEANWPSWLEKHLEDEFAEDSFRVLNLGVSGATARRGERHSYDRTDEYDALLESAFDLAIVTLGTNDAKVDAWDADVYGREYAALLGTIAASSPNGTLALGIPVPYLGGHETWGSSHVINVALGRAVRDIAAALNISRIVDFYAALGGDDPDESKFHDEIHPNEDGYRAMATTALAAVEAFESDRLAARAPPPTRAPTRAPTPPPTRAPSRRPSNAPTTAAPSNAPTAAAKASERRRTAAAGAALPAALASLAVAAAVAALVVVRRRRRGERGGSWYPTPGADEESGGGYARAATAAPRSSSSRGGFFFGGGGKNPLLRSPPPTPKNRRKAPEPRRRTVGAVDFGEETKETEAADATGVEMVAPPPSPLLPRSWFAASPRRLRPPRPPPLPAPRPPSVPPPVPPPPVVPPPPPPLPDDGPRSWFNFSPRKAPPAAGRPTTPPPPAPPSSPPPPSSSGSSGSSDSGGPGPDSDVGPGVLSPTSRSWWNRLSPTARPRTPKRAPAADDATPASWFVSPESPRTPAAPDAGAPAPISLDLSDDDDDDDDEADAAAGEAAADQDQTRE